MLRAARFIARFELTPTDQLVDAVERMAARMEIVSAERVRDEFDKLMVTDHPAAGLWFLHDTVSPTSSCRSCRRCASNTIRSTVTRTS